MSEEQKEQKEQKVNEQEVNSKLKAVNESLDKEIKEKERRLANLTEQARQIEIKEETDKKLRDVKTIRASNFEAKKIQKLKSDVDLAQHKMIRDKQEIEQSQKAVAERSQRWLRLEEKEKKLFDDTHIFNKYKRRVEEELKKAQQIIEKANVQDEAIEQRKKDIKGIEEIWNKRIEELDLREVQLQEDREALKLEKIQSKEAVDA